MSVALDTNQIFDVLNNDEFSSNIFKSVHSIDQLPNNIVYPSAYVINNKGSNHPGEHWLSVYYNNEGEAYFFDSFARGPYTYGLGKFLAKTSTKFKYNTTQIQSIFSEYCGYYCIYFILLCCRGIRPEEFLKFLFNKKLFLNDYRIKHLLI